MASLCSLVGLATPAAAWAGWGSPVQVIPSGGDPFGKYADVGFDQAGNATVAALGTGGRLLVATRPAGGGPFSSGQLATAQTSSMAVSRDGAAVIAYRVSSTSLVVAYRPPGGSFNATQQTYSGTSIGNVAAGIDDNGNAVVAWLDGAIRVATSSGASFGAAQSAPLGASPGFNGSSSVGSRDDVPRAFIDDAGDVLLAYLDGATPTVARRAAGGAWDTTTLPGGAASLLSAAADPQSRHYIVGYVSGSTFRAYEGDMASPAASGTVAVSSPTGTAPQSVAVRPGGSEDLAVWSDPSGAVQSASCLEGYHVTSVGVSSTNGVKAAVTSGDDELAFLNSSPGIERAARSPGGGWALTPYTVSNYGSFTAFGADYSGDALVGFVDYPNDTAITGFPYSGAATANPPATSTCAGASPQPPQPSGASTAATLGCDYYFDVQRDTCTFTVEGGRTAPGGNVRFTSSNTTSGGVLFGSACSLSNAGGGTNLASCGVQFLPGSAATTLTASYGGDASHAPSSATFTICNNPQTGLALCDDPSQGPAVCSVGVLVVLSQCYLPAAPRELCARAGGNVQCSSTGPVVEACGGTGSILPECHNPPREVPRVCGGTGSILPVCTGTNQPVTVCAARATPVVPACAFTQQIHATPVTEPPPGAEGTPSPDGGADADVTLTCPTGAGGGGAKAQAARTRGGCDFDALMRSSARAHLDTVLQVFDVAADSVIPDYPDVTGSSDPFGVRYGDCLDLMRATPEQAYANRRSAANTFKQVAASALATAFGPPPGDFRTAVGQMQNGWWARYGCYLGPRVPPPPEAVTLTLAHAVTNETAAVYDAWVNEYRQALRIRNAGSKTSVAKRRAVARRRRLSRAPSGFLLVRRHVRVRAGHRVTLHLRLSRAAMRALVRSEPNSATVVPIRVYVVRNGFARPAVRYVDVPIRIRHVKARHRRARRGRRR